MNNQYICTQCHGNGRKVHEETCMMCHGEGVVERRDVFYGTISGVCSSCRGQGAIQLFSTCSGCGGSGTAVDDVAAARV